MLAALLVSTLFGCLKPRSSHTPKEPMRNVFPTLFTLLALTLVACGGADPTAPAADFLPTLSVGSTSLTQGQQTALNLHLERQHGFADAVSVALTDPPAGITMAALTISSGSSAALGPFNPQPPLLTAATRSDQRGTPRD